MSHGGARRRPGAPGRTVSTKIAMARVRAGAIVDMLTPEDFAARADRPRTRGDCADAVRPCPWAGCRYHLAIDVKPNGSIKVNHPGRAFDELEDTCSLDVAERDPAPTLNDIGRVLNLTRERVRQIELRALQHLQAETER